MFSSISSDGPDRGWEPPWPGVASPSPRSIGSRLGPKGRMGPMGPEDRRILPGDSFSGAPVRQVGLKDFVSPEKMVSNGDTSNCRRNVHMGYSL